MAFGRERRFGFVERQAQTDEKVGNIQGKRGGSLPEWRVAQALYKFKIPFQYQVGFFGGRRFKGGQVVDFMVLTRPVATALFVDGEYWHGSASQRERDRLTRAALASELGKAPVVLTGGQLATQDMADDEILKLFGDRR